MLNWILATVAIVLWTGAYGCYYREDIAGAWARWRTEATLAKQPRS